MLSSSQSSSDGVCLKEQMGICAVGVWTRHVRIGLEIWDGGVRVTPSEPSDVERAIGWPNIPHADQQNIDQSPDTQTAEAEELPQTFPPLAQIEAVRTEAAQRDAEGQSCGPLISSGPVTEQTLLKHPLTEAVHVLQSLTGGVIASAWT